LPSSIEVRVIVPVDAFAAGKKVKCWEPLFGTRATPASVYLRLTVVLRVSDGTAGVGEELARAYPTHTRIVPDPEALLIGVTAPPFREVPDDETTGVLFSTMVVAVGNLLMTRDAGAPPDQLNV